MGDWWVLLAAMVLGGVLLAGAAWLDRRRRCRTEGTGSAPERGEATVDLHRPDYITQGDVDALPLPASTLPNDDPPGGSPDGVRFGFGHLRPEFATHGDRAELVAPAIVLVDGEITTVRELLPLLQRAASGAPLVVAALGFSEEVLDTLAANRKTLRTPVVAASPGRRDLYDLASLLGTEVLGEPDLKSGYLPDAAVGHPAGWTSDLAQTWVSNSQASKG